MSAPTIRRRTRTGVIPASKVDEPIETEVSCPSNAHQATSDERTLLPSDYKVGFCRPPRDTRFGGKRGNRSGRKKGEKTLGAAIEKELNSRVTVNVGGRMRSLSKRDVLALNIVNAAIAGKPAAQRLVTNAFLQAGEKLADDAPQGPVAANEPAIPQGEAAGLIALLEMLTGDTSAKGDG